MGESPIKKNERPTSNFQSTRGEQALVRLRQIERRMGKGEVWKMDEDPGIRERFKKLTATLGNLSELYW
ncbi:hypothetical protein D1AOALGA4SA_2354 [Olavius algarvensis Delta 1 endosymbiont]|nr:hypothetical protein D1AOALGA4SA_2354 [Olavius algarvensis Delta 1 endosymbiont]